MANLSKIKREQLLNEIEKLKTKLDTNDFESLNTLNKLKQEITNKKYGLVWEEHSEKVDEMLKDNIPVFTEDKSREIVSDPTLPYNFLIEGDNLHALKLLEKTHKGKIDVIYIDPPYNTGNKDFIYDDDYVDKEDAFKHSKWLSFMKNRLTIGKNLLSDDGLIFISINDEEVANLRLLLDGIFGEFNLYSILCVEMSKTQGMKVKSAQSGAIVKNQEYILVYCKDKFLSKISRTALFDRSEPWDNHFNCILKQIGNNQYEKYELSEYIKNNHNNVYKLFEKYDLIGKKGKITPDSFQKGIMINDDIKQLLYTTLSSDIYQQMACSVKIPDSIFEQLTHGKIVKYDDYILELSSGSKLRQYRPLIETLHTTDEYVQDYSRAVIKGALWKGFYSDMMNVAKEGGIEFKNGKKPKRLIEQILKYINRPNAIVLDFFAGSGTTAEAVSEMNKLDKGNRIFILCTDNAKNDDAIGDYLYSKGIISIRPKKTHQTEYKSWRKEVKEYFAEHHTEFEHTDEFNLYGISQRVTYPRIKTVITGKRHDGTTYSNGIPANLKYYKTDFIPKNSNQNQSSQNQTTLDPTSGVNEITLCDKLQDHIRELVQLETHHNIDDDYYKMVLDDTVLSNLITNINKYPNLKEIYISSTILLDSNQKQILESKNIKVSEIPDYYFSNELKENGELW